MENDQEEAYWEIEKFIRLALKANPNVLECLYAPFVETCSPLAQELIDRNLLLLYAAALVEDQSLLPAAGRASGAAVSAGRFCHQRADRPGQLARKYLRNLVGPVGFEPTTNGL